MAKGFMIFVEGMEPPKKVHKTMNSAWKEMVRLADIHEGKEIFIFHLVKRMMKKTGADNAVSIGSHFPDDVTASMIDKSQLVSGKELKKLAKAKAA